MSNIIIYAIVEGKTEKEFVDKILMPYLYNKNIFIQGAIAKKSGQSGGDIKFSRIKNEIRVLLLQQSNVYVTTFIDLYGVKEWPGKDVPNNLNPKQKADHINKLTHDKVNDFLPNINSQKRFIPYIAIHEFEAMLFSDPEILANKMSINKSDIDAIISKCGEPEKINNSPQTAPSKRLDNFMTKRKFDKTAMGIDIARKIGIDKIREKCPVFNAWIETLEQLEEL